MLEAFGGSLENRCMPNSDGHNLKKQCCFDFFFNAVVLLLLFCFKYILNLISKPTSNSQSAEQSKATVPFNWS